MTFQTLDYVTFAGCLGDLWPVTTWIKVDPIYNFGLVVPDWLSQVRSEVERSRAGSQTAETDLQGDDS